MCAKKKGEAKKKPAKIPYHRKPHELSPQEWQIALRRQFAAENPFEIESLGEHPLYGDFRVFNPASTQSYKVAIRSSPAEIAQGNNLNFCACYDFKTNRLGTCKHIEAVLGTLHRNTRLRKYFKLQQAPEPGYTSVSLHYGEERTVRLRIGGPQAQAYEALAQGYFSEDGILLPEAFASFDRFLAEAKALSPEFRCYDDALLFVLERREKERREGILQKQVGGPESPYFDSLIKAKLFPYQREGVWFAAQAGRAMIADEMGLGKTIQAIATAELLKKELRISRVLIVCPTSLKYQWKSEIEKFTDSTAHVVEGPIMKRAEQYREAEAFYHIVSYHAVGRDIKVINEQEYDLIILDEAQRIKNWKTKTASQIKRLSSQYAVVLTGTPLENKLEELYSIIQFIDPFLLGSLFNFLGRHQVLDVETGKVVGYQHLNEVGERLAGVMIRRRKKEVLRQLPKRQDKNLLVPMTENQRLVHSEYQEIVAKLVARWRRMGFLPEKERQRMLISLNMMRMSCDSTYIIDQKTRHDTKIDEVMGIMEEVLATEGNKMVIFSQWERMTRLVAAEMEARGIQYAYLHGGVESADRGRLLTEFRDNPECLVFLSTDAGGTGLNLQVASYLVNLDIPWNPAVLEQRIARVYRMGQENPVSIINLVSSNTIEHRMLDVLRFKESLFGGVLDQGDDAIFLAESRFNQFMESVDAMTHQAGGEVPEGTISEEEEQEEPKAASGKFAMDEQEHEEAPSSELPQELVDQEENALPSVGEREGRERETAQRRQAERPSPQAILGQGISFFSQLGETLKDPKATREFMEAITERDAQTGQTFLKIPVESQEVVGNALQLLAGLFGAMGGTSKQ